MKIYITDIGIDGVARVTDAMRKYLPDHHIYPVDDPDDADIINCHAMTLVTRPGIPMVASCHGLHWAEDNWPIWSQRTNREIRDVLMQAEGWTATSEWVRNAMVRGVAIDPTVVYHGTEIPERVQPTEGYVLWNKTRIDPACDPTIVGKLAELLPDVPFVTTHLTGDKLPNVHVTGRMPHAAMLDHVARAGVYLATTRETFGVGTIEAMAAGIPVAGWDFGGQREIIRQGETGILVPFGDTAALGAAITRILANRAEWSERARTDAIARWQWPDKIAAYARLFYGVHNAATQPRPKVSIIVPFHNTGKYLGDAVASVRAQSLTDWEMVIIDDASTDEESQIALDMVTLDERIQYAKSTTNIRPSAARNWGVKLSRGQYVMPLDSDDMLAPGALETLASALDADRSIHIAYGHLDLMHEDGQSRRRGEWPGVDYDFHAQASWRTPPPGQKTGGRNQLPYCPMMRREVIERTGGYRTREKSVEDAGLWLRATSLGFKAKKVTQASTIHYRLRGDSWSQQGGQEQDYTEWIGWRNGTIAAPWGAQGDPPAPAFWPVHHCADPLVTFVITVGPNHERHVINALDSVFYSQRLHQWECIVVNDTGHEWGGKWNPVQSAPWARVLTTDGGPRGVAHARNVGWRAGRAPLVVFLDADDHLLPTFMEDTVFTQRRTGGIVYTDAMVARDDTTPLELVQFRDFEMGHVLDQMQHTNTVLIPRAALVDIDGIDETLPGWEDWDMLIAMRAAGWCSERVPRPGLVYHHGTGQRREESLAKQSTILDIFRNQKWKHLFNGEVNLAGCGCSKGAPVGMPTGGAVQEFDPSKYTIVEYTGTDQAARSYRGNVSGARYRFAATPDKRMANVDNRDLAVFRTNQEFVVRGA